MSSGCSAAITVALATAVNFTAEKKNATSKARPSPPGNASTNFWRVNPWFLNVR